jgi:hypothetical protein
LNAIKAFLKTMFDWIGARAARHDNVILTGDDVTNRSTTQLSCLERFFWKLKDR